MDRNNISKYLKQLKSEFDELMPLFDFPKEGLNGSENLEYISTKYTDIKTRVADYHRELEREESSKKLNRDELAFLVPAVREVYLHCAARKGSKNRQKLVSSIYDGQSYCSYWLSQLNA